MAASAPMCRVSIRTTDREADVSLPAHIPIGELLPAVVDLIGGDGLDGAEPQLARVCGERLDPGAPLAEYAIPDGEMLILTSTPPPVPVIRHDPSTVAADAVSELQRPAWRLSGRIAAWLLFGWATSVLTVVLGHPVLDPEAGRHPVVSGAAAALALAGAAVANRTQPAGVQTVGLGLLATAFAGLTAGLVPADQPAMSAFLLAMAATSSAALLVWRLLDCAPAVFLPLATATMMAAVATVGAVIGWWSAAAVGPGVVSAALGMLAVAPRLSVHSSGLAAAALPEALLRDRAEIAHRRLTAIAVAAGWAAALGALLTAVTTSRSAPAGVFLMIAGVSLLLRALWHHGPYGKAALSVSSAVTVTALLGLCAAEAPPSVPWLCGVLLVIAACAARRVRGGRLSPAGRRALAVLDPVLGAAVVPAACAAAGLFAGVGLPW